MGELPVIPNWHSIGDPQKYQLVYLFFNKVLFTTAEDMMYDLPRSILTFGMKP
jgi:hypothetical protein